MKTMIFAFILGVGMTMDTALAGSFDRGFYVQDRSGFSHSNGKGKRFVREERPPRAGRSVKRVPSRLSDEERRQLHRDLDKANRELYRERRGGRGSRSDRSRRSR
jgi:hypothetical protein